MSYHFKKSQVSYERDSEFFGVITSPDQILNAWRFLNPTIIWKECKYS